MLQVTEAAASVFRRYLDRDDIAGDAIRLVPQQQPDGQTGIGVQAIQQPDPADQATESPSVRVVVAAELGPSLDAAILDARETDEGADLFVRDQATT